MSLTITPGVSYLYRLPEGQKLHWDFGSHRPSIADPEFKAWLDATVPGWKLDTDAYEKWCIEVQPKEHFVLLKLFFD